MAKYIIKTAETVIRTYLVEVPAPVDGVTDLFAPHDAVKAPSALAANIARIRPTITDIDLVEGEWPEVDYKTIIKYDRDTNKWYNEVPIK